MHSALKLGTVNRYCEYTITPLHHHRTIYNTYINTEGAIITIIDLQGSVPQLIFLCIYLQPEHVNDYQ